MMSSNSSVASMKRELATGDKGDHCSSEASEESDGLFVSEDDDDDIVSSGQYNESSESLPNAAAYDKDFYQLPRDISQILTGALDALGDCDRNHPSFKIIFDKAEKLINDPKKPKRRINIVGKSGAGKSSLLNSLIGRPGAARALSASRGCTQVATSYESPFPDQSKSFAAKIEFFPADEMFTRIELMLRNYNLYHFSQDQEWSMDDLAEIKSAATTAFEAFRTLFCSRGEFISSEVGHEFLRKSSQLPPNILAKTLTSWCLHLRDEQCPEAQDASSFEADTQQVLSDYLEQFAFSSSTYANPELWPLVKMIRQGLNVEILQHVTIIDWPGSDDTNQLRAKASSEQICDGDEIWIVSDAARIVTEPSVKKNLLRYGDKTHCVVVCTCIDRDLEEGLASVFEKDGYDTGIYHTLRKEEQELERSIDVSVSKILKYDKALRSEIEIGPTPKRRKMTEDRKTTLASQKARHESTRDDAERRLQEVSKNCFESLFEARKNYIRGELEKEISSDNVIDGKLCLHFAANTHYNAHKGGKKIAGPHLSPAATGVPALRAHILEAAAPDIMSTFQNHVDSDVTAFLYGIEMLVSPADLRDYKGVLNIVKEREKRVRNVRRPYEDLIEDSVDRNLMLSFEDRQQDFVDAALSVLNDKQKWSSSSIRAFVRKDGCHATRTMEYQSWTHQFMASAADTILKCWKDITIDERTAFESSKQVLIGECNDISLKMKENPAVMLFSIDTFDNYIKGHIQSIEQLCTVSRAELAKDLARIQSEATEADDECPTGYFKVAMQEAWDTCKQFSGPGSKAKVMAALEQHLKLSEEHSPFAILASSAKSRIIAVASERLKDVTVGMGAILREIRSWLEAILRKEDDDPKEIETRHRLKKYVDKNIPKLISISGVIKVLDQRYGDDRKTSSVGDSQHDA